jgi:hypothetical protein
MQDRMEVGVADITTLEVADKTVPDWRAPEARR